MIQSPLVPPASAPLRWWGHLRAALSTAVLFPALILVNGIQLASLVTRPFSKRVFRSINRACANFWWGFASWWTEDLYGVRAVFSGDVIPPLENAIVVANHQEMPDIVALWSLAKRKGRLGDMKWVLKDVLRYVPGVGWGARFLDCLFLKRNWEADQALIAEVFAKFSRENIPVWLTSFSEGTRITPAKLERSQAYARKAGLPVFQNVLLPRTKGFVASVEGLRGHIQAVYDVTIAYPGGIPSLWQLLQGFSHEFHLHVRRYAVETLPLGKEALADWLVARFREKDELLQTFHEACRALTLRQGRPVLTLPSSPWESTLGAPSV